MNPKGHSSVSTTEGVARIVDFNIHNLAGIRLVNPSERDLRIVQRHLGLAPDCFFDEPALTIKFVDRIEVDGPLRFLGRDDVGFTDQAFVMLRSRNLARARARLAMDQIGANCEITCETGLPAIPLLRQLLNLVMLARGIVPIHSAAFSYQGAGVLVAGWSHGSKTGTLLAFMAAGAKFVGDEWIYLSPGHDRIYGLPDQLEARPWYLGELPQYRRRIGLADRFRIGLTSGLAKLLGPLVAPSERRNSIGAKLVRYAHQALHDQQSIHLRPGELFGDAACSLCSTLDLIIVAVSHGSEEVLVTPASVDVVASQLASSFMFEHAAIFAGYRKFRFAFPDRRNPLLEGAEEIFVERVKEGLREKNAYTMLHPYPVKTAALRAAVEPLLANIDRR